MQAALLAHVLHRQRKLGLVAEDGLVLRAVVHVGAADVLHQARGPHVQHEHDDAQHALEAGAQEVAVRDGRDARRKPLPQLHRKIQEQSEGQHHRQHRGDGHQQLFKELVPLAGLLVLLLGFLLLVQAGELRRAHQALVAEGEGVVHVEQAPDEGQLAELVAILSVGFILLYDDLTGGVPHGHGGLFRAAHHDALQQRLAADTGLFCHVFLSFLRAARAKSVSIILYTICVRCQTPQNQLTRALFLSIMKTMKQV